MLPYPSPPDQAHGPSSGGSAEGVVGLAFDLTPETVGGVAGPARL